MKKNLSDYLVAIIVIACSLVLLAALTFALSGHQLKKPTRTLKIDYADITGINLASQLRYAGAPAGNVIAIHPMTFDERNASKNKKNAVRVTVSINEDVPPLPADVKASIDADTLLSEKFISLSSGTPDGKLLPDGTAIQGNPGGLDALLHGDVLTKVDDLLASLQGDLSDVVPKLGTVLETANSAVKAAESFLKNANSLVDKDGSLHATLDKAHDAVEQLKVIEKNLDDVIKKTGGLVGSTNQNLDARMKEIGVVLQNLKVVTTYLKEFSKQIAEKPNRVIFMGKATKLTPEDSILKNPKPAPAKSAEQQ